MGSTCDTLQVDLNKIYPFNIVNVILIILLIAGLDKLMFNQQGDCLNVMYGFGVICDLYAIGQLIFFHILYNRNAEKGCWEPEGYQPLMTNVVCQITAIYVWYAFYIFGFGLRYFGCRCLVNKQ